jgi:copper chaperone NosL
MMIRRGMTLSMFALVSACSSGRPDAIVYDADQCAYCRMEISDPRFGAELVTRRGRTVKFDSIECLLTFYKQAASANDVSSVWVSDFRHPGTLIIVASANFVDIGVGRAPMGRGWAAVASIKDAAQLGITDVGAIKRWSDLK